MGSVRSSNDLHRRFVQLMTSDHLQSSVDFLCGWVGADPNEVVQVRFAVPHKVTTAKERWAASVATPSAQQVSAHSKIERCLYGAEKRGWWQRM
jgi:hypothetical protein